MDFSELSFEQIRLIFVVYFSAITPFFLIPYLYFKKRIPSWSLHIYILFFLVCAFGWELWFNYGLLNGDNVNIRRANILNSYLPIHFNWFLNSLADSGTICLGGLFLALKISKNNTKILYKWNWNFFFVLLIVFIAQNLFVEMYLYHDQLSIGKLLSWAPLSPLGSQFNPTLFKLSDRTISLQSQMPWIIMTPLFYRYLIYFLNKNK
tara:strand:- start:270 stop:890 length:621 start_codon:yes stop_codon:yes gene_type:complete